MTTSKSVGPKWERLLQCIELKNVIPVVGQGLYRVDVESEGKENLLYDYLAERVLKECGNPHISGETHKFAKACLEYLKKPNNHYLDLSTFLKETLKNVRLKPANSLWKLARIKSFDIFINTAYNDFLKNIIKTVRTRPTELLCYTTIEKSLKLLDNDLFKNLKDSQCTLVYHIFGNMRESVQPAYTERDILETIVQFHRDMVTDGQNNLFQKLKSSSLLFMGCGYDDWLFRFFIRTVANEPYELSSKTSTYNFVGDVFEENKKDPFAELPRFLKNYKTEIYHAPQGCKFVDKLFAAIESKDSEAIIQPPDFPGFVFISFTGTDRPAAQRLAEHLREDGIDVWLDERKFKAGDPVDETIIKAIDRCPVFIPLISKNSQKIHTRGKLNYHIREWEWALKNLKSDDKIITIIPVIIDDTVLKYFKYEAFKDFFHYKIPGGEKVGDYENLRGQLEDIQKNIQG